MMINLPQLSWASATSHTRKKSRDEDGKGRYPPTLNISNGWAEEVTPWGVMQKEHDPWQQTSNIVVTMSPYDKSRYILQSKASAS